MERLEHESHAGATDLGAVILAERGEVTPFEQQLATVGYVESRDQVQQRGLADAGFADDRNVLTRHDGERDAVEHAAAGGAAEGLGNVTQFEHGTQS